MILYLDTSALVKRYVIEEGTIIVDRLWQKATYIATSVVAYAESVATFGRKTREGLLNNDDFKKIITFLEADYKHFILIPVSVELNEIIKGLVKKYPLRGFDAIHLASAILLSEGGLKDIIFLCFDKLLSEAALSEGLNIGGSE